MHRCFYVLASFMTFRFLTSYSHYFARSPRVCTVCGQYGADWDEYKKAVPYLFVPYVI